MVIVLNLYDWSCAELIHTYVDLHFDDFCEVMIDGSDISELEYVEMNIEDFKEWAYCMGYEIETEP